MQGPAGLWRAFGDYVRALDAPDTPELRQTEPVYTRSLEQITGDMIAWHEAGAAGDWRTLPAVTGARRLIASTIDQIPVIADGDPGWLRWPRRYGTPMDRGDLVQHAVDSMILHGTAYWVCTWSGAQDNPSWKLLPIHPTLVSPRHPSWGWPVREFIIAGQEGPIPEVPAQFSDLTSRPYLLHIPYVVTVDHPEGTSPLIESAQLLRGFVDTEAHVANMFASGNIHGGYLTTTHDVSIPQLESLADAWTAGAMRRRIRALGNGLEYQSSVPNASDLQLVEARSFNQSVIWALLGIPQASMGSSMMGGQSSLSYSNAQDNRRQFADNCLRAFTTQIEDAVTRLLPMHSEARFDYSEWEGRDDGNQDTEPAPDAAAVGV